eukprot:NODE_2861_length_853_cov_60.414179_g2367_i0.p2 GENE.NODE_2861_length_853_cov_60.414179_g2367_i0~~NODE_2861_length_853_cov_60.414179_g2367_i0.p2  ORF type:complete len:88 (-),score=14.70 NODE_2861_length_853_cov_60.414179_g2367_i0:514-777(-)
MLAWLTTLPHREGGKAQAFRGGLVRQLTKEVLRQCPVPGDGEPEPPLFQDSAMCEFVAEYFLRRQQEVNAARRRAHTAAKPVPPTVH